MFIIVSFTFALIHLFINTIDLEIINILCSILMIKVNKKKITSFYSEKENKINNKFLTLDIETRTIIDKDNNNVMKPFCISFYDGQKAYSFYLSDYLNEENMIISCLNSLLIRKYRGYKIYVHNLSKFDGIFLLKILSNIKNIKIDPILKDGNMINIKINKINNKQNYIFVFRDSYLLLPLSLKLLSKAFYVENKKGIFPFKLNDINYNGNFPSYSLFDNISYLEYYKYYSKFINSKWSFKEESMKYCELDCISLYQVLIKFNELIYEKYSINIHKSLTLPSLTMRIFRTHYLKENTIPIITGECYKFIKSSYTGGHTDVYKPYSKEAVITIDVNSLYPFIMSKFNVPIGQITYFEGDITKLHKLEELYGFFEADIESPNYLKRPTILTKIKTNCGFRTIAPLGSWTDTIFSEELKYNQTKGYNFNIKRGYLFDKGFIFKEMINDLYNIKLTHIKSHPLYTVAKLLMNSLYGKFGMDENLPLHKILSNEEINSFKTKYKNTIITDITPLTNNKSIIQYILTDNTLNKQNISIGIAAAINALSRIYMNEFILNDKLDVLYIDTDAIHIKKRNLSFINETLLDEKALGKFKTEYSMREATYLAPKVYGGLLDNTEELVKIKGFKNKIKYSLLKSLLTKDSKVELQQEKWFKNLYKSEINVKESLYTLQQTESKRKLIYDNNLFYDTEPFTINKDKKIIK